MRAVCSFNGRRIPAVQFTYNIQARLHHKDPEPRSFEELSDTHLYSAGMRVGQELKRFMLAYARDNLQALAEGKPPRPLPIFFVKFDQLEVRRLDGLHPQATGNPLKRLYRKLTVGIRKGVSRMLSIKWDEEKGMLGPETILFLFVWQGLVTEFALRSGTGASCVIGCFDRCPATGVEQTTVFLVCLRRGFSMHV